MGWSSGSRMMDGVIKVVEETVLDHDQKIATYYGLIAVFEEFDCDTLDECLDESKAFDQAYRMHYKDE